MTTCPWCAEQIPEGTTEVCPHCGSRLSAEPASTDGGWAAMPGASGLGAGSTQVGGEGSGGEPGGPATPPSPTTYTHSGFRYVLGYDATGYAIWDRQSPTVLPRRFPRTDDGWQAAWRTFVNLEPQQAPVTSGSLPAPGVAVPAAASKTNGMAVASLVTAILFIPIIPIVLGHISKRDIERSQGTQEGRGLAIAGLVIGWVTLGLLILMILGAVLFFSAFGDQIVGFIEHDADARTLLQNAVVEANHYQDKEGTFLGISPKALEPTSIHWNTLTYPSDGEVSIRDVGADRILLVTRTNLGVDYCVAIVGGRTTYGTENPSSAVGCTGGWAFDWQPSD